MKKPHLPKIREILRKVPEGLTVCIPRRAGLHRKPAHGPVRHGDSAIQFEGAQRLGAGEDRLEEIGPIILEHQVHQTLAQQGLTRLCQPGAGLLVDGHHLPQVIENRLRSRRGIKCRLIDFRQHTPVER